VHLWIYGMQVAVSIKGVFLLKIVKTKKKESLVRY
jgi:hypothetical protein